MSKEVRQAKAAPSTFSKILLEDFLLLMILA